MKRFLQWFIALLQILFGLAFAAAVLLFILDKFDIDKLKSEEYLKYIVYGCAGLYAVLSLIVMVIVLKQRAKAHTFVVSGGGGIKVMVPGAKVKKLFKQASASVEGVSLKKHLIEASTAGYTLKLKINVTNRDVKEASEEFKGVVAKLCEEACGLVFADIEVVVAKIKNDADAEGAKKEVQAEMAAMPAEPVNTPETETAPSYYAPPAESFAYNAPAQETFAQRDFTPAAEQPAPQNEAVNIAAAPTATVYTPVPEAKPEPIIKTVAAPKTAAAKAKTSGAKASSAASSSKAKTTAKTTAKSPAKTTAKTAKQVVDPNDPPPFKL